MAADKVVAALSARLLAANEARAALPSMLNTAQPPARLLLLLAVREALALKGADAKGSWEFLLCSSLFACLPTRSLSCSGNP